MKNNDWYEPVMDDYIKGFRKSLSFESIKLSVLPLNKVSSAVNNVLSKSITKPQIYGVIHKILRRALLSELYITNYIKTFVANCSDNQTSILSKAKSYIDNLIGKISTQLFVNRTTKQSIKLLPAS